MPVAKNSRVLIVEDDARIRQLLRTHLAARGFEVRAVETGEAALDALVEADAEPGVVLLDLSLPGISGLDTCRRVREWSSVPILLLTANDNADVKIAALESGADDYLTKPFHVGELVARIRAVQRRTGSSNGGGGESAAAAGRPVLATGDLVIDLVKREVRRGDDAIRLTRTEFDLLRELATHPDRVLTYAHLLETVWGAPGDDVRPVHVHVSNLRRKLTAGDAAAPRYIHAVPGIGYRFEPPA